MGDFLFVDISNVAVDILTLSMDDPILSINLNVAVDILTLSLDHDSLLSLNVNIYIYAAALCNKLR